MNESGYDRLLSEYNTALDTWLDAIRIEQAVACADPSLPHGQFWESAVHVTMDAGRAAKKARDAYEDALRKKNYGF